MDLFPITSALNLKFITKTQFLEEISDKRCYAKLRWAEQRW